MKRFKVMITNYNSDGTITKEIEYMSEDEIQTIGFDPELTILDEERDYYDVCYKILDIEEENLNLKKNTKPNKKTKIK